jgi:hypothetical protein
MNIVRSLSVPIFMLMVISVGFTQSDPRLTEKENWATAKVNLKEFENSPVIVSGTYQDLQGSHGTVHVILDVGRGLFVDFSTSEHEIEADAKALGDVSKLKTGDKVKVKGYWLQTQIGNFPRLPESATVAILCPNIKCKGPVTGYLLKLAGR